MIVRSSTVAFRPNVGEHPRTEGRFDLRSWSNRPMNEVGVTVPDSILIVDDDPDVLRALERALVRRGFQVHTALGGDEALAHLREAPTDVMLVDLCMPGLGGLDLLRRVRESDTPIPVVVMSGTGTIPDALEAVRLGACDFVEKPVDTDRLMRAFARASDAFRPRMEGSRATGEILGRSEAIGRLRELITRVAPAEGRVLITGENGTGKELVATAIHAGSPRHSGPFVQLNCSAVPRDLVESELFGHERGAFTGAHQLRRGRFELAHGGTLFLDEIGDMPLDMQAKLLRVLQEGRLERLGSARTLDVDVRVVAATHRDLQAMVTQGSFREDLFYRLDVLSVHVPSLRERRDDIPLLAEVFLARSTRANRRTLEGFTAEALATLTRHDFPGNVRELQNVVERFAILSEGPRVTANDVVRALDEGRRGPALVASRGTCLAELVERFERHVIEAAIAEHGSRAAAARALEVERSFFYKKCKRFGIVRDS